LGLLGSSEHRLTGSGGYVVASLTEEQRKKADLGGPELFLAPLERLERDKISMYFCNRCNAVSKSSPEIQFEKVNEQVAENLLLGEKGKYVCGRCRNTISEYKVFVKIDENFKNSEREKEDKIWDAFQASKPLEQDVVPQHNAP